MPVLVLTPRRTPDTLALHEAASQLGWTVDRLESWRVPESLLGKGDVAVYGEALFVRFAAEQLSINLIEPPRDWLHSLPDEFLQRAVTVTTLAEARMYSKPAFIKPAGDKAFDADIYPTGMALPSADELPDTLSVIISEPVKWMLEIRAFMLNGDAVCVSPYKRDGESVDRSVDGGWTSSNEREEAQAFVSKVISASAEYSPPAFVCDAGVVSGRGWAVIEANPAWASGIYGCNAAQVLPVIKRACVHQDALTDDDRRWIGEIESWDI